MSKKAQRKDPSRKRLEITDASGWTHVVKGKKTNLNPDILSKGIQSLRISNDISTNTTHESLLRTFKYCQSQWLSSPCWSELESFLRASVLPRKDIQINKCICLGLGCLTTDRQAPKYQLAALLSILETIQPLCQYQDDDRSRLQMMGDTVIKNRDGRKLEIIFQDPAFQPLDVAFLTLKGQAHDIFRNYHVRVIETPQAFDLIDEKTFLFAPHLEHEIFAHALSTTLPWSLQQQSEGGAQGLQQVAGTEEDEKAEEGKGKRKGYPSLCIANSDMHDPHPLHSTRPFVPSPPAPSSSSSSHLPSLSQPPTPSSPISVPIADPPETILKSFATLRSSKPLPTFDRDTWCYFTSIYWKAESV